MAKSVDTFFTLDQIPSFSPPGQRSLVGREEQKGGRRSSWQLGPSHGTNDFELFVYPGCLLAFQPT